MHREACLSHGLGQLDVKQGLRDIEFGFAIVLEHQPFCHEVALHVEGVDCWDALALDVHGVSRELRWGLTQWFVHLLLLASSQSPASSDCHCQWCRGPCSWENVQSASSLCCLPAPHPPSHSVQHLVSSCLVLILNWKAICLSQWGKVPFIAYKYHVDHPTLRPHFFSMARWMPWEESPPWIWFLHCSNSIVGTLSRRFHIQEAENRKWSGLCELYCFELRLSHCTTIVQKSAGYLLEFQTYHSPWLHGSAARSPEFLHQDNSILHCRSYCEPYQQLSWSPTRPHDFRFLHDLYPLHCLHENAPMPTTKAYQKLDALHTQTGTSFFQLFLELWCIGQRCSHGDVVWSGTFPRSWKQQDLGAILLVA